MENVPAAIVRKLLVRIAAAVLFVALGFVAGYAVGQRTNGTLPPMTSDSSPHEQAAAANTIVSVPTTDAGISGKGVVQSVTADAVTVSVPGTKELVQLAFAVDTKIFLLLSSSGVPGSDVSETPRYTQKKISAGQLQKNDLVAFDAVRKANGSVTAREIRWIGAMMSDIGGSDPNSQVLNTSISSRF